MQLSICEIKIKMVKVVRLISTARLNTLLCLYLQPINVVIFYESYSHPKVSGET